MSLKLVPAALLLVAVAVSGFGQNARNADALVNSLVISVNVEGDNDSFTSGSPVGILLTGTDDSGDLTIQAIGDVNASFIITTCIVNGAPCNTPLDVTTSANEIVLDTDVLDGNAVSDSLSVGLVMTATCTSDTTLQITANDDDNSPQSASVQCLATVGPGPGVPGAGADASGFIRLTATPDVLFCGGTSTIHAELVDEFGVVVPGIHNFHFMLDIPTLTSPTGSGDLVQVDHNTARVTLTEAHRNTTVRVGLPGYVEQRIWVQNFCAPEGSRHGVVSVAVTAHPNVIECNGTTLLTATGRDAAGHIVEGVGYHFEVTSGAGLLTAPGTAETIGNQATLSLKQGRTNAFGENQGSVTVTARIGEVSGTVTVHQDCLGTTTGLIQVNASQSHPKCGERVFIGLSVKDVNLHTVVDGTGMILISDVWFAEDDPSIAGGFVSEAGTSPQVGVRTSHGEANVIFIAPKAAGEVRITAASGDLYGYRTLHVSGGACAPVHPPSTGTGSLSAPAAAPCVPIGDNVCITPPATGGNRITPPSTGNAGMK